MPLAAFHPIVETWFTRRFGAPTEAQRQGWPAIMRGEDTLIAAPTGSGKTLAAFLWCLDRLLGRALRGELADRTQVLYVSPLKALSADVERNLAGPLGELECECEARLHGSLGLRVALRTGDTPQSERQRALRRPPHILVTTPESLYLLLTAPKARATLAAVETVIVDEIHALANNKRGAHLALSLERLEALVKEQSGHRPVRIGLSATQRPLDEVARFLVGAQGHVTRAAAPACTIVDTTRPRTFDLAVETPVGHVLSAVATHEMWETVYDRIAQLASEHRTTLVFANTRRLVERTAHALGKRMGEDAVAAHHGSLSRERRFVAEERLKNSQLKLVVATASLELGIDVGAVELVVQLGSPRGLSVLVQRIGRSGHWLGGVPKGRLMAMTRDELVECAALVKAVRAGELDRVWMCHGALDVLGQQLVAECAAAEWDIDALYRMVTRAWPYATLSRQAFDQVLELLVHGVSARRSRASAYLHLDAVNGRVKARRGARLSAMTSGGAIPDNADFSVIADPEGIRVGTVSEDFAVESMRGDIFLLGNTSWRIRRVEATAVRVEDAQGAPPTIPFWQGEAPGRTYEASQAVSALRQAVVERLGDPEILDWLKQCCALSEEAALQAIEYIAGEKAALGVVPTMETVVAERFFDEAGGMQLVIHSPFGSRINRAWGLALRKRFCRSFNFELQAAATDDGIVISLGPHHSFPLETVFRFVTEQTAEDVLTQALLGAPMFGTRWRWTVTRALAVLRFSGGKRVPPQLQRMRAEDMLAAVFPDLAACPENLESGPIVVPEHPLVQETIRDCLNEPMDLAGMQALLGGIESGQIRIETRDVATPSPFCEAILNANPYAFLDDAPLEERRTRAVMTRRPLAEMGDLAALDPAAIREVVASAQPLMRDADELHDALLSLTVLPELREPDKERYFKALVVDRRATRLKVGQAVLWTAAERLPVALQAYAPAAVTVDPPLPEELLLKVVLRPGDAEDPVTARLAMLRGWMEIVGPVTAEALAERLCLPASDVLETLAAIEGEGQVLRGRFTPEGGNALEWCDRRLLARIQQLTLGRLRKEIAPVEPADLMRFLFRWQHVHPGTQLHGQAGVREVLGQLQGIELAAAAWERDVLPKRIAKYESDGLDLLCARGELVWGRLGMHADTEPGAGRPGERTNEHAREAQAQERGRGPSASRVTPIGLYQRSELALWLGAPIDDNELALGGAARAVLHYLRARGASFFQDIARGCRLLPAETVMALSELVAAGRVTGDSFAALRSLFGQTQERKRPLSRMHKRPHDEARRQAQGRWSLLMHEEETPGGEALAEARARQLLARYGIVFRDLLVRERVRWSELVPVLRRMEMRGEVRGGRFVASFVGEQFALPAAVEALREVRKSGRAAAERAEGKGGAGAAQELVTLAATDPLNLVGILTPGPRVPAVLGNRILFRNGVPIASREAGVLVPRIELGEEERLRAARLLDPAAAVRAQALAAAG